MTEWFTPQEANALGAFMGMGFGIIGGAIGGPLFGYLAPRGKGKPFVLGFMAFFIVVGVGLLVTAAVGAVQGQPKHVTYPFLLVGMIMAGVTGVILPVAIARYRDADRRKLAAEEMRRG